MSRKIKDQLVKVMQYDSEGKLAAIAINKLRIPRKIKKQTR